MVDLFYELSNQADNDLVEIFDYTLHEFGKEQAIEYTASFDIIFNQLIKNPLIGHDRNEIRDDLRSFVKEKHVIFYRVLEDRIRIVRILHGSRDLPKFLT